MKPLFRYLLPLLLVACASSTTPRVECGDGGSYSEDEVGRYCSYIVVRGGFTCPVALPFSVPVGTGLVCTDVPSATLEGLPPEACAGLSEPRCGVSSLGCAAPTRDTMFDSCAAAGDPVGPPGVWTRDLLDVVTDAALDDGDRLVVGTQPDGTLGASVAMRPDGDYFRCHVIEATVIGADGSEVQTAIGSALTSGGPRYVFTFTVPGVGPAVVRFTFVSLWGELLVWERELELTCE